MWKSYNFYFWVVPCACYFIFNLYQIARYCDAVDDDGFFEGVLDATKGLEPRFSCNLRIQDSKNAFETLGNIASIFRGFSYWDGVGLNFSIDRDKEISAIFNNGNVFDGIFNYGDILSSARFTKVEVIYADANDLYGSKLEYIEDEDAIRRYGLITKTLNILSKKINKKPRETPIARLLPIPPLLLNEETDNAIKVRIKHDNGVVYLL